MKKKLLIFIIIIFILVGALTFIYLTKKSNTPQIITEDNPRELHVYTTNKNDKDITYISPGTYNLTTENTIPLRFIPTSTVPMEIYISNTDYTDTSPDNTIKTLENEYSKNPNSFYYDEFTGEVPTPSTFQEFERKDYSLYFQTDFTIKKNQYLYIYIPKNEDSTLINYYTLEKISIN